MADMVNHPNHYANNRMQQLIGAECIEFSRHFSFDVGNAFKYVWRCLDKGTTVQDLDKAIFYLNDHVSRIYYLKAYCDEDALEDLVDRLYAAEGETAFEKKQLEVLRCIYEDPKSARVVLDELKALVR